MNMKIPGDVDLSIEAAIDEALSKHLFERISAGVCYMDGQRKHASYGEINTFGDRSVDEHTLFDIASLTKFFVSLLYHACRERDGDRQEWTIKGLRPDALISRIIPMAGIHSEKLLLKHLIHFQALFSSGHPTKDFAQKGWKHLKEHILERGFMEAPGTTFKYGNPATIVAGHVLETMASSHLDILLQRILFEPLAMKRTVTSPINMLGSVVNSHGDDLSGSCIGKIHDPTARMMRQESRLIGSAGFFSTVDDVLNTLEMLLHGGVTNDGSKQVISKAHVDAIGKNVLFNDGTPSLFGDGAGLWNVFRRGNESVSLAWTGGFFKMGHTGCIVAVLPNGGAVTILTDYTARVRSEAEDRQSRKELYRFFAELTSLLVRPAFD